MITRDEKIGIIAMSVGITLIISAVIDLLTFMIF